MGALRILCDMELPEETIRVWDGAGGPFVDADGNIYRPAQFTEDALQSLEAAINAEAFTLSLSLVNVEETVADQIWDYDETTDIRGSIFRVKLQELDDFEQPVGEPDIRFTGEIDNMDVSDQADDDGARSVVTVEITNRFTLRTLTNGSVLSDVDQKALSSIINPLAAVLDRIAERISRLRDKKIKWPNW